MNQNRIITIVIKIWKDPVWSKVIAAGFIVLMGLIIKSSKSIPWLSFIPSKITLPFWLFSAIIILLILTIYYVITLWIRNHKNTNTMPFTGIKEGVLDIEGNKCEYSYNIIADKLCKYKVRCKQCNLVMNIKNVVPLTSRYFPIFSYTCSCQNKTITSDSTPERLKNKIELLIERDVAEHKKI